MVDDADRNVGSLVPVKKTEEDQWLAIAKSLATHKRDHMVL
jgi:hypothetical protein